MAKPEANATHIFSKDPADGLRRIFETVEATQEQVRKMSEEDIPALRARGGDVDSLSQRIDAQQALIETLETRLRFMDENLPKGQRYWQPMDGRAPNDPTLIRSGEMLFDLCRAAKNQVEKYGWAERLQKEGADADGGFLVPPEQSNEVINLLQMSGVARKYARRIPMGRKDMRVPTSDQGPQVYWPDEGDAPAAESKVTVKRPELNAKKLLCIDSITLELDEDADSAFMVFLLETFASAIALEEDRQFLMASNDPFMGFLYAANVVEIALPTTKTSFENVDYASLINFYDAAHERVQEDGMFFCSNFIWNMIRRELVTTQKEPLMATVPGPMPATLFNRPVALTSVMPRKAQSAAGKPFMAYFDPRKFGLFGDRRSLSIDVSPHADFKSGRLVMRFMERVAIRHVKEETGVRLKTSAS